MYTLGVIPARGGSKRIPRKNIRDFCGKPLIAWTIEAALDSTLDEVIVSTDDEEIRDVAHNFGAWAPFLRPKELATDSASTCSVIRHALQWVMEHRRCTPENAVILQPTSPLRMTEDIDLGLRTYKWYMLEAFASGKECADGAFYAAKRDGFFSNLPPWVFKDIYDDKPMPDIDTEEDWKEAERLMSKRLRGEL